MHIVIKTPSFIGDTVMMMPALELLVLAYPDAKITVVCKPILCDLFRDKNVTIIVDETKQEKKGRFKRTLSLLKQIRANRYDLGVLFHNTFIDALLFKLAKINTLIGYDKEFRKILLDFYLKIDRTRHYVNHYSYLVNSYLGDRYSDLPRMKLYSQKSLLLDFEWKYPIVGFVLGGENKGTRTYPKALSLELFKILKGLEIEIVLLGDDQDSIHNDIYETYLKANHFSVLNLSGKTDIGEFVDAIASLDLLVTIDTSAVHISAAVETKFVMLVGKGSSAVDTTFPKVNFGSMIFEGQNKIRDEDLIYTIQPQTIKNKILEIL